MLENIKRGKRMEGFKIQEVRDVVKAGGDEVLEKLEEKFIKV